ncbi:MAG: cob(I)yrinic acid a,c-diamide adenosyltransferase [Chloroflexi bacterium]|nr:MAG: cob(I)yrinic acid a,c-diamide adenosyltransferase [Chloroflexota bacterium]
MPRPREKKSMLYTRSGDTGTTGLFGGGRVPKDSARVDAYGSVDELNSALGVAASFLEPPRLRSIVGEAQNELFNIGSELASETGVGKAAEAGHLFLDPEAKVARLEALIDEYDAEVPPLRTFILPSRSQAGAQMHFCRTVCRRAERAVVRLSREEAVNAAVIAYLNRLSDLLFVLARYVNKVEGKPEIEWRKG